MRVAMIWMLASTSGGAALPSADSAFWHHVKPSAFRLSHSDQTPQIPQDPGTEKHVAAFVDRPAQRGAEVVHVVGSRSQNHSASGPWPNVAFNCRLSP